MSRYRVTFIHEVGKTGFSEVWYTTSNSGPQLLSEQIAANSTGIMALRGNAFLCRGIRVNDIDVPRRSFMKILNMAFSNQGMRSMTVGENDTPQTALLGYCTTTGGKRRPLLLRGLDDELVSHDSNGLAVFNAAFRNRFALYLAALKSMNLAVRLLSPGGPGLDQTVTALSPTAGGGAGTLVTYLGAAIPDRTQVIFHGLPRDFFPGFSGVVPINTQGAQQFAVPIRWQAPGVIYNPIKAVVRPALYTLDTVLDIMPEDFRSKKVGRPSLLSRGRRSPMRFRSG